MSSTSSWPLAPIAMPNFSKNLLDKLEAALMYGLEVVGFYNEGREVALQEGHSTILGSLSELDRSISKLVNWARDVFDGESPVSIVRHRHQLYGSSPIVLHN